MDFSEHNFPQRYFRNKHDEAWKCCFLSISWKCLYNKIIRRENEGESAQDSNSGNRIRFQISILHIFQENSKIVLRNFRVKIFSFFSNLHETIILSFYEIWKRTWWSNNNSKPFHLPQLGLRPLTRSSQVKDFILVGITVHD